MFKIVSFKNIIHIIGMALVIESLFMIIPVFISILYSENNISGELIATAITLITGFILYYLNRNVEKQKLCSRDSFVLITLIWIIIPLFGTLPYILTSSISGFINPLFESVSGFTTTGASILNDIEALPKGILMWRALTHWLGGMGIIVLVVAVMRNMQIGGSHIMAVEGSLLGVDKIKPRLIDVAKRLWTIYMILTLAETILLMIAGMDLFDAVCHSFATIATGGFSTKNTSIIEMSPAIQYIISVFMILSGVNFSLHYFAIHKKFKKIFSDEEFRMYIGIIGVSTILITINIFKQYNTFEESFRHSLFQVSSILTCTGFASADYEIWPSMSKVIIFSIMFIGASVGSTGGGIKVARIVIILKSAKQVFKKLLSPNTVKITFYNKEKVGDQIKTGVFAFISIYIITFITGTIIMCAANNSIATSAGSIVTTLGGIGPGFGTTGPIENFFGLNIFSKLYLSANMILGRLEILSVLVIFHPSFRKL